MKPLTPPKHKQVLLYQGLFCYTAEFKLRSWQYLSECFGRCPDVQTWPSTDTEGGITLYYLATQSSPEEAEDRWRYGCCSRHHDPHSSPQRLLRPRFKKHVSAQIVTETGSRYLLDQNRWISGPGLCGRWVCPTGCCSWWCPPSLQRTSSPQRSSTAISWKAIWRHSEPGDGGFVYTFRQEKLKNDRLMFKAEDGERGLAVVSEDKRSLTLS